MQKNDGIRQIMFAVYVYNINIYNKTTLLIKTISNNIHNGTKRNNKTKLIIVKVKDNTNYKQLYLEKLLEQIYFVNSEKNIK